MRTGLITVLASTALLIVFSAANAGVKTVKQEPLQCVNSPVIDTRIIDDDTLLIVDREGHAASLTLSGPCLKDRTAAVLIRYNANGERICHPADADITSGRGVPLTCSIKHIEMMSLEAARVHLND